MSTRQQIPSYLAVGVAVTVTNVLVYAFLTQVTGLGHKISYSAMYVVGLLLRFFLERRFVFQNQSSMGTVRSEFWRFAILVSVIYVLGLALFGLLEASTRLSHFIVLGMVVIATTLVGFLGSKHIVFSQMSATKVSEWKNEP